MENLSGIERRSCIRFQIPGSTVSYKYDKPLPFDTKYIEEFCTLLDISRGGLRFLSRNQIKAQNKVELKILIPGERIPLNLKGIIRWFSSDPDKNDRFQIGVQFNPYGEKKSQNYPGILVKLIALEQKFSEKDKSKIHDDYEVE